MILHRLKRGVAPLVFVFATLFLFNSLPPTTAQAQDLKRRPGGAAAIEAAVRARHAAETALRAARLAGEAARAATTAAQAAETAAREALRASEAAGFVSGAPLPSVAPQPLRRDAGRTAGDAPRLPSRVISVGPNELYRTPSAAARVVRNDDTVEIAAGVYEGDVAVWLAHNLTIRAIGGRAHLKAAGQSAQNKAIWVIKGNNNTIENIEFSGTSVPDLNGAGIRLEGTNLTLRNCFFHDNQMGILTGRNLRSDIVIESSEFARNTVDYRRHRKLGHNIYIGEIRSFTLRNSYVHGATIGHNVKSRARLNLILNNRLADGAKGDSSYIVDLPNGGIAYLIGNLIQQSRYTDNSAMVNFASRVRQPSDRLFVVNNTMVSDLKNGIFVINRSMGPALLLNNIMAGGQHPLNGPGRLVANLIAGAPYGHDRPPPPARMGRGELSGNLFAAWPGLRDAQNFDFRLLPGSPAIDAGNDQALAPDPKLSVAHEYVHPLKSRSRPRIGSIDIGAYEFQPQ